MEDIIFQDNFWWKTPFNGGLPPMEDDAGWKITFHWRQLSMGDNLWWRMTFHARHPLMEEKLWWKMTYYRRWPLMGEELDQQIFSDQKIFFALKYFSGQKIFRIFFRNLEAYEDNLKMTKTTNIYQIRGIGCDIIIRPGQTIVLKISRI